VLADVERRAPLEHPGDKPSSHCAKDQRGRARSFGPGNEDNSCDTLPSRVVFQRSDRQELRCPLRSFG
jgi:hypothetical protein